jgi:hypothetical protein
MEALPDGHPLNTRARIELAKISESASSGPDPVAEGFTLVGAVDTPLTNLSGWCDLTLSAVDGSIVKLRENDKGRDWANASNPLALLRYQTLIDTDMARFSVFDRQTGVCTMDSVPNP